MTRISMGDVWADTRAFVRREAALLTPVALATFGVSTVLLALVVPAPVVGQLQAGPWLLWLIPATLLLLTGTLAISALVLAPQVSVGDAFRLAFARLPRAVGLGLLLMAAVAAISFVALLVGVLLGAASGASARTMAAVAGAVMAVPFAWLGVRTLPLWPLLVDRDSAPVPAIRGVLALTEGLWARLFAVLILYFSAYLLLTAAVQLAAGSMFLLLGRALGSEALGATLTLIADAAVATVMQAGWAVFVAFLYRRIAASKGM